MKVLVLGCGSIGKRHAQNALALSAEVAIFDIKIDISEALGSELGIKNFSSLDAAMAWQADGIIISTPHKTHLELANIAIKAGADVLIEKPLSNSSEGVQELLRDAKACNQNISVVCNIRYHDAVLAIKKHIDKVGKIIYARAQYGNFLPNMRPDANYREVYSARKASGGGVILDVIHEIDYLIWLLGSVNKVNCVADKISDLDIDVEDFANMTLTHHSGARSSIHVDYLKPFKRRGCEIVGDQGMIIWQSEGKFPEICTVKLYDIKSEGWTHILDAKTIDVNLGYLRLMEAFLTKIKNPHAKTNLSNGEQGFEALNVALRAEKSAELGGCCVE